MGWYEAAEEPELVHFGPVSGLSVTGRGAPGGETYCAAVGALYAVISALGAPMVPLEGRWWVEDERSPFDVPCDECWWHMFLRVPDDVLAVDQAREEIRPKVPAAARVQLASFAEGRCVQTLHRGRYADMPATLDRMDAFMKAEGLVMNGLHHEIYLSDGQESTPDEIRTILRHPAR